MRGSELWARLPDPPGNSMNLPQNCAPLTPDASAEELIAAFGALMAREMNANWHKGDRASWRGETPKDLLSDLHWHVIKLSAALRLGDKPSISEYTADVANMAMMIADVYGLL